MKTTSAASIALTLAFGMLGGGVATAVADPAPMPSPTASTTEVSPRIPADAVPDDQITQRGVTIRSYIHAPKRAFGVVFQGLRSTDEVKVMWTTIRNPQGEMATNIYHGTDPTKGYGEWYSGHQVGWVYATGVVIRDGQVIAQYTFANKNAVKVKAVPSKNSFNVTMSNVMPTDRMLIKWTFADGSVNSVNAPAGNFSSGKQKGWKNATITVYEGNSIAALLANPVTITPPVSLDTP
ncbi:hypothetical protein KEM60_02052 [Austwickia sp. TVS 96-490-7B]|uniref:hypothetical protein n=1 Tax=Austwickia sp. TVS 96-490-7B TaxID=2830843 RepID=UPI001C583A5D|nr:hypothetical protein [Austwickia sp. TVS 96-490-7B]MBW3085841.1 hypothetical protein [Austwickia sp. TVS 96-490-7B]